MSEGFANPIIGGGGGLVYPSIHSPNFVHGSAGWSVNKDGTAEFQNATVRGTISASTIIGTLIESAASGRRTTLDSNGDIKTYNASGAVLFWFNNADNAQFYYADTGSAAQGALAESIAAVAGTDPFGNTYQAGVTTYAGSTGTFINLNGGALKAVSSAPGGSIDAPSAGQMEVIAVNTLVLGASSGSGYIAVNSPLSAPISTSQPGALGTTEPWHAVTLPAGMTGTIRVKVLPMANFAVLDVNVTITSTSTSAVTFTGGSLPSASYYPTGQRQFPLSINQGTGTAPAAPRVNIPASGAIALNMPPFATAGNTCLVSGTIVYPLD